MKIEESSLEQNNIVFEDDEIQIMKKYEWPGFCVHQYNDTGNIMVSLLKERDHKINKTLRYIYQDTTKTQVMTLKKVSSFHEGLAYASSITPTGPYGYIDASLRFVIPEIYSSVSDFSEGYAVVGKKENGIDTYYIIDKDGNEFSMTSTDGSVQKTYMLIDNCSDGMFRVSIRSITVAGHHDHERYAGFWGYLDATGKEIIPPQYIYAYNFENGRALVCKGEWVYLEKKTNEFRIGDYYSKDEQWGMIDKTGKEVIPCVFDQLDFFYAGCGPFSDGCYRAHYGGWEKGKWGIIDSHGKWIVEPQFEDIGDEISNDGLVGFYVADYWSDPDNIPMGIYSILEKRIVFETEFFDVSFPNDTLIFVEVIDEKSSRRYRKAIDREGRAILDSPEYKWISLNEFGFLIGKENGLDGVIDIIDKKEIIPFKYNIPAGGISAKAKRFYIKENKKEGIVSFDMKVIVPSIYEYVRGLDDEFVEVSQRKGNDLINGLLAQSGEEILPCIYNSILVQDDFIIANDDDGASVYQILRN